MYEKTVTYKIQPDGDCEKCESRFGAYCPAFKACILRPDLRRFDQHQECKDFLVIEKSKVLCKGCEHFVYWYRHIEDDWWCDANENNNISYNGEFNGQYSEFYCIGCKDRSVNEEISQNRTNES